MTRAIVVGGGVLGTMHAREALQRGHEVLQLESDVEPRSASVRNFGLIWISGRAPGTELKTALFARELWDQIAAQARTVGFRAYGSLTLALTEVEAKVMEEAATMSDAASRGMSFVEPHEIRRVNPAIRGNVVAGLSLGWNERVDLALSAADVGRGRPAPDMILGAVIRLQIDDVRQVAVVGDTLSDLWAGERAGASIVAGVLTGAHDRATLETAPHTHLLDTVWEVRELIAASNVPRLITKTTP